MIETPLREVYARRRSSHWRDRLRRLLEPPAPLIHNPQEDPGFPVGARNLYLGGAGSLTPGYLNVDLLATPEVDVVANAEALPFRPAVFDRVECDAVLEHVRHPDRVIREITRVLRPGGYAHLVTPFCHPFHAYPDDYRRFTPQGLKLLLPPELEVIHEGWRTGPAATMLVFTLEFVKQLLPWRLWRIAAHGVLGWTLWPLRYLDLLFFRRNDAGRLGNHCFLWVRKRERPHS
ncbi:MAG: class I SAM-dependent methyltransferase [Bryobacteraceae bacterium]|nr:class I SAM-dependent methyltransferase [Bryobacteraceae bacterium]MDW8379278.1 class I SAM-dependent methyltransferase [Bryobacterales bacterium]